ncbi:DUF6079 family protein [Atopococcus tabaci]|uniref:DUF6079 family protein n=1 Tax=Atopococcus tabaci TaxID=269774 RepID=UPI0003FB0B5B|nr:DUF6079 family protein [Atopococcus tabaci]
MLYKDLVNFEPIQSVVKLTDADEKSEAFDLLSTYVISERMEETITTSIFEQLQFERPVDNKGLLIVGNYGSGKSHLMGALSTIAEHKDSSLYLQNKNVAQQAKEIEGKFKVIRLEIGSTTQDLRGIITTELEAGLTEMGIDYHFPDHDKIVNNKDSLYEMMEKFNDKYPDKGLLIVVDELLDYLRARKEQELTLDLGFLREIGEIAHDSRFRFIAGIQERIFDNPRFGFVSDALRRVKERFTQVRIVKEDIAYVISERLLKKTPKQKSLIREHLSQFTTFYNRLSEDIDTYVNLYPIHPAYLTAFEKVHNIEKRVALNTITAEMNKIINEEVPKKLPGVISFDNYWQFIEEDPSNKTIPEVKEVLEKSQILKDRINNGMAAHKKRVYSEMAVRIIDGLALHRLSSDDIYSKIGLSSEELRDGLFLTSPMLEMLIEDDDPSDTLRTQIEAAIKEIMITVNYQFISMNEENGQYYLDLKKDIDIDSQINNQAELIEPDKMDSYYFDLMKQAITLDDTTYVTGYKIWQHELPWRQAHVMRQGYLFFGSPNERSTAQPERDFYIYFLRPFHKTNFKDEERSDEVFFELNTEDEKFEILLKRYAAAKDLQTLAAQGTRQLYSSKIIEYQKALFKWLQTNFINAFSISYKGKKGHLIDLGIYLTQGVDSTIKEIVNDIAAEFLGDWFDEKYDSYPRFKNIKQGYLSNGNIKEYAADALQQINGRATKMGEAILDGLVLLDKNSKRLVVENSGYANWLLDLLNKKGNGKVLNNEELFDTNAIRGVIDRRLSREFKMEPELVVVLIGALLYSGKIEVSADGESFSAIRYSDFASKDIEKLSNFSYIKKTTDIPVSELSALFDLYNVPIANFNEATLTHGIKRLVESVEKQIKIVLNTSQHLKRGYEIGNKKIIESTYIEQYSQRLKNFKNFSESLTRFNTPAKMKNMRYSLEEIKRQQENKNLLESLVTLKEEVDELSSLVNYVNLAKYNIGQTDKWSMRVDEVVSGLIDSLSKGESHLSYVSELSELKAMYIDIYLRKHDRARLNASESTRRTAMLQSSETDILTTIAEKIDILSQNRIYEWKQKVTKLKECYGVTRSELEESVECPHCKFSMSTDSQNDKEKLVALSEEKQEIYEEWLDVLVTNLRQPNIQKQMELLEEKQKELVSEVIQNKAFASPINREQIDVIDNLLKGLEKVEITNEEIAEVLGNGKPLTAEEFRERIQEFVGDKLAEKNHSQIRITYRRGN